MSELKSTIEHVAIAEDAVGQTLSLLSTWKERQPFYVTAEQKKYLADEIARATKALTNAKIAFSREAEG